MKFQKRADTPAEPSAADLRARILTAQAQIQAITNELDLAERAYQVQADNAIIYGGEFPDRAAIDGTTKRLDGLKAELSALVRGERTKSEQEESNRRRLESVQIEKISASYRDRIGQLLALARKAAEVQREAGEMYRSVRAGSLSPQFIVFPSLVPSFEGEHIDQAPGLIDIEYRAAKAGLGDLLPLDSIGRKRAIHEEEEENRRRAIALEGERLRKRAMDAHSEDVEAARINGLKMKARRPTSAFVG